MQIDTQRLKEIIKESRKLVVRIGKSYELTRPLILKLWKDIREQMIEQGYSVVEDSQTEFVNSELAVVKVSVAITDKKGKVLAKVTEVGEAFSKEFDSPFIHTRVAITRGRKRIFEVLAGYDFVNEAIKEMFISEEQAVQIQKLLAEKGYTLRALEAKYGPIYYLEPSQAEEIIKKLQEIPHRKEVQESSSYN